MTDDQLAVKEDLLKYKRLHLQITALNAEMAQYDLTIKETRLAAPDGDQLALPLLRHRDRLAVEAAHLISCQVDALDDISEKIRAVKAYPEQNVLWYKYVNGMHDREIAKLLCYDERHIRRLHARALRLLAEQNKHVL